MLFALPGASDMACSRLGITASRKVGGAVVRNRCRRRLRELFRVNYDRLGDSPLDLVVNARRGCENAPWKTLEQEYKRCLRKLRSRLGSQ